MMFIITAVTDSSHTEKDETGNRPLSQLKLESSRAAGRRKLERIELSAYTSATHRQFGLQHNNYNLIYASTSNAAPHSACFILRTLK